MSVPFKLLINQAGSYLQAITSRSVQAGDHTTRFLEAGPASGIPLIFLHGLGGSKAQWRSMMSAFAGQYRVLAPDVPGLCIHAPLREGRHTLKQLMVWLDDFVAALGVDRLHIIAHSTACPLAAVYAGERDRVQSMALISFPDVLAPSFSGQGQAYRQYRKDIDFQSVEDWDAFFRRAFYSPVSVPNAIKRYNFRKFKQHSDTFLAVVDDLTKHQGMVMPCLKQVHGKTLVINGDHDNFADENFHRMLETHLPQARHLTLERCGHMAFIDRYSEVVACLDQFFNGAEVAQQQ
ncbi:MAG: alpha/beta hydrolase [Ketobacteraceae bacterium]|nr:alpha/beta hydrolase [Ketobacteraceae bacterium]